MAKTPTKRRSHTSHRERAHEQQETPANSAAEIAENGDDEVATAVVTEQPPQAESPKPQPAPEVAEPPKPQPQPQPQPQAQPPKAEQPKPEPRPEHAERPERHEHRDHRGGGRGGEGDVANIDEETNAKYEQVKGGKLYIRDLQQMDVHQLHEIAKSDGIPDYIGMKKQDLIFQILRARIRQNGLMYGEGVLEILPDGFGFLRSPEYNYLPVPR